MKTERQGLITSMLGKEVERALFLVWGVRMNPLGTVVVSSRDSSLKVISTYVPVSHLQSPRQHP
jgi:hypothetical protein